MNEPKESGRWVIGDIHGHADRASTLLTEAGLIADDGSWSGGSSVLWFVGDFFDRGPDGIGAARLAMRLQEEAIAAGGWVGALLGNHELIQIAVVRFGSEHPEVIQLWEINGGRSSDLEAIGPAEIDWIASLPAAALLGDDLLVHCDSNFYLSYGSGIDEINDRITAILQEGDFDEFFPLLESFFRRFELSESGDRRGALSGMLETLGARRVIHGHTPIPLATDLSPGEVTGPFEYSDGRCLNVDGGIYLGGAGFVVPLG